MNNISDLILLEDKSIEFHKEWIKDDKQDVEITWLQTCTDISKVLGKPLVSHDIFLLEKKERKHVISILREVYWIDFIDHIEPVPFSVSLTSKKCILVDLEGKRYFLKDKPVYSHSNKEISAYVQQTLAQSIDSIPGIIPRIDGALFTEYKDSFMFLTPFIEWNIYDGDIEKSIQSAKTLAQIHGVSDNMELFLSTNNHFSWQDTITFFLELLREQVGICDDFQKLEEKILELLELYMPNNNTSGTTWYLHRDYAPFNLVFWQNHEVLAVNDFDNSTYWFLVTDLAELIVTHCIINYIGPSSSFRAIEPEYFDITRAEKIIQTYIEHYPQNKDLINSLPQHIIMVLLEILCVGLLRWDFDIRSILWPLGKLPYVISSSMKNSFPHSSKLSCFNETFDEFSQKWTSTLQECLPAHSVAIDKFISDNNQWLYHSFQVLSKAHKLASKIENTGITIDFEILELLAVFHDIGKFFQELHSLENLSIAESVFNQYASGKLIISTTTKIVLDGIRGSDFYNKRLDPSWNFPSTIEWDIIRAADKMQDNLTQKVDRYWYEYGVPRGATFYDKEITLSDREKFSFDNFSWDQLNVILSIIGLRDQDFSHPVLQSEYIAWSTPMKNEAIKRIVELAKELWYNQTDVHDIQWIIEWYRRTFNC